VFDPGNLSTEEPKPEASNPQSGSGAFGNVFDPGNLDADD